MLGIIAQMQPQMDVPLEAQGIGVVGIIVLVLLWVFAGYCLARMAKTQGYDFKDSFIMGVIPIANAILFLKLAGKPWWWLFLMLIPLVNFVIIILAYIGLCERMGRPAWWCVLLFIPIVNIVIWLILVFGEPGPGVYKHAPAQ